MPGTEITIGEKTWVLQPPKGLKSIRLMPKVVSILSEWVYIATQAGIPLGQLLQGDTETVNTDALLKVLAVVANQMGDDFDVLADEIFPFLLQCHKDFLRNNGEPHEIIKALWIAIKFHFPYIFGTGTAEALKKLVAVEEVAAEQATDSTLSET